MPLVRIIQINSGTKVGIWHILEPEDFFAGKVKIGGVVHHPHKRLQHLAARYLLSVLDPDFPLQEIKVSRSQKPFLSGSPFYFSLAHSGDYAAAILSKKDRVGIDVEITGAKVIKLAQKFLNLSEMAFLNKEHLTAHLLICWSAKEAVYKWNGSRGIDFRENILLQPFLFAPAGRLDGRFTQNGFSIPLHLQYQINADYCVTWLVDEK